MSTIHIRGQTYRHKKALTYEASQDAYHPATGGFIPPGMPGHSDDIGIAYDPDRARKLLGEAGFPEGRGFQEVRWSFLEEGVGLYGFL